MEVRYNLPTTKGETCKFNVTTNVKEIKEVDGNLFGPAEDEPENEEGDTAEKKKSGKKGGKRKGCKGKNKNKKKCKGKGDKKKKPKPNKPQKHQPVKSIHLKVCTR